MKIKKILVINASPRSKSRTEAFCKHFENRIKNLSKCTETERINLRDYSIPPPDGTFRKIHGDMAQLRKRVSNCDGMFVATPTYWYNAPSQLKAFIEHLTPIESELSKDCRKLALAVYSPDGGELGVFNAVVAPLNMMGFSLVSNGFAWRRGPSRDKWWKEEVSWMAKTFCED